MNVLPSARRQRLHQHDENGVEMLLEDFLVLEVRVCREVRANRKGDRLQKSHRLGAARRINSNCALGITIRADIKELLPQPLIA